MRTALRRRGWERCFNHAIERARSRVFKLGAWDCCIFAADCVNAITGVDPAQDHRGMTQLQAARTIKAAGGLSAFVAAMATRAGLVARPVACAQRGDVVLLAGDGFFDATIAVCVGAEAVAPGKSGLVFQPMAGARACWHINHS